MSGSGYSSANGLVDEPAEGRQSVALRCFLAPKTFPYICCRCKVFAHDMLRKCQAKHPA